MSRLFSSVGFGVFAFCIYVVCDCMFAYVTGDIVDFRKDRIMAFGAVAGYFAALVKRT